jgi:hypothetical protein
LEKQFGIVIPTLELTDTTNVAKLARCIIDHSGIGPAIALAATTVDPSAIQTSSNFRLNLSLSLR